MDYVIQSVQLGILEAMRRKSVQVALMIAILVMKLGTVCRVMQHMIIASCL